jgi:hypothetical protein
MVRGDRARALSLVTEAEATLERGDLGLNLLMIRRAYGRFLGGAEGDALVARADAVLEAEGLQVPARIVRMFAPTGKD